MYNGFRLLFLLIAALLNPFIDTASQRIRRQLIISAALGFSYQTKKEVLTHETIRQEKNPYRAGPDLRLSG